MLELVEMILRLTNSKSRIVHLSLPEDDPHQRKPDIYLAKRELNNWQPIVTLEEGLRKTIDYFSETINNQFSKTPLISVN